MHCIEVGIGAGGYANLFIRNGLNYKAQKVLLEELPLWINAYYQFFVDTPDMFFLNNGKYAMYNAFWDRSVDLETQDKIKIDFLTTTPLKGKALLKMIQWQIQN